MAITKKLFLKIVTLSSSMISLFEVSHNGTEGMVGISVTIMKIALNAFIRQIRFA